MEDCIFCKIVNKEIPSEMVYEDDEVIVFKDINPRMKTHLLIVPKKHIESVATLEDEDKDLMGHMILVARNLGSGLGLKGYQLQIAVGKDGGQEVFHIHMHLMSKFA